MNGKRISISIVAVAAVAAGITVSTVGSSGQADWQSALNARSEALNDAHGVRGERAAASAPSSGATQVRLARTAMLDELRAQGLAASARARWSAATPDWAEALMIRSDALNKRYGLGGYARSTAGGNTRSWLDALLARSAALNREYKLGEYAP